MEAAVSPPSRRPKYPSDRELSYGIRWSLIFHVGLAIAVLIKSLVFPSTPVLYIPSLRVDIVGLPDVLKKDLKNVPKAPVSDEIERALREAEKKAEQEEVKKPKATKRTETAEPDEMVLKPKKDTKKDTAKQEKETAAEREKRMKSALSRIKSLAKISAEDKSVPVKGNKISKGTSLSGDARESAAATYFDLLRDRLQENWALPVWLQRQKLSATVVIWIDSRGRLRNFKFTKPSGNAQFDEQVKRTLQESQPFPTPPEELASSLLVDGVPVGFPL